MARLVEDFGADDVAGHQIWGELNAVEAEAEGLGDGVDEERFGETWNAHKQNVPACKNRGGDLTDHLILTHDDLADFGEQGFMLGAGARRAQICRQRSSPRSECLNQVSDRMCLEDSASRSDRLSPRQELRQFSQRFGEQGEQ